jgi:hypothetical protein
MYNKCLCGWDNNRPKSDNAVLLITIALSNLGKVQYLDNAITQGLFKFIAVGDFIEGDDTNGARIYTVFPTLLIGVCAIARECMEGVRTLRKCVSVTVLKPIVAIETIAEVADDVFSHLSFVDNTNIAVLPEVVKCG